MTEKFFVDTNILVYAKDAGAQTKQKLSAELLEKLWIDRSGRISYQVLSEYLVVLSKKYQVDSTLVLAEIEDFESWKPCPINQSVFKKAKRIFGQYKISWWDSLILGAAEETQCGILYSEDLSHDTVYSTVRVCNPFL